MALGTGEIPFCLAETWLVLENLGCLLSIA